MRSAAGFRLPLLAACIAAVATIPGFAASAHNGAPFWSTAQAQERVLLGPVYMNGREVRLDDATCMGAGSLRIKSGGVFKYRHFNCLVTPARERRFWIYVHSRASGPLTYSFLHWA